ncbi:uncharacterized protein RCO7_11550 [Rhynchosporium graminicola]|uniref:Uncharacterized protein n=1 Tax=Rhynchosporium graminicola TaxID=2792576 RepID=A0A1E1LB43_9HELO|nr:uncharacterized protein RCO7_11550 [Rhynchosporium commune]
MSSANTSRDMAVANDIIAEHCMKTERASFLKRKGGVQKKVVQLKKLWPFCDMELKIKDNASKKIYLLQTAQGDLDSISSLKRKYPDMVAESLNMDDFTTDEDTNEDDDEDSGGDRKSKRRTMKNIKLRKKQTRTTPTKTKADKLAARRPADRIPPPAFIKALVSGKKPGNYGGSTLPAPKQTRAGRSGKRNLPPFPILESGGTSLDTKTTFDVPFGLGLVRRKSSQSPSLS